MAFLWTAIESLLLVGAVCMGGCGGRSPGTGLPLVIAATIPLTGDAASYGEIQKRGYSIALQHVNQGHDFLRVVYKDTQLSPRQAVNALQQSILQDNPQVVFSISTAEVLAEAPICNERRIVLLSPLASGDDISRAGPYVFRVSPTDSFQGRALANKVLSLGVKRIAVLSVNDSFGVELARQFSNAFTSGGGQTLSTESVSPNQMDLRTVLQKVDASHPEGIFLVLHPGQAVAVLRQIRQLGIRARLFGADTFSNRDILKSVQAEAQGVVFALPAKPDNSEFRQFNAEYQARYGEPADINAAAAYDSVMLVGRAVQNGARTGDQVRSYFAKRLAYEGATGIIQWDEHGGVVSKDYAVYIISGDSYKPLH